MEFANQRVRIEDWEVDTVLRHRRKDKACLVTLVDGKSRFLIAGKAKSNLLDKNSNITNVSKNPFPHKKKKKISGKRLP